MYVFIGLWYFDPITLGVFDNLIFYKLFTYNTVFCCNS